MNIHEALKNTEWRFAEYFKYKFPDLRYDQSRPLKTEQDFLNLVARKSMNPFYKWEKSQQYKNLLMLYLDTKIADDFEEVYRIVSDKAKQGDEKAIKLFLQLQKEVSTMAKLSSKSFESIEEETEVDDLQLD